MSKHYFKLFLSDHFMTNSVAITALTLFIFSFGSIIGQNKMITVDHFDEVIISPHIEVTFRQGDKEAVTVEKIHVPIEKLNVEVNGKTLRIYLDGAKLITESEKAESENWKGNQSIYNGTIVTVIVTYKELKKLSLRGEETFVCESLLEADQFQLNIYGESQVYLNEVKIKSLKSSIYGESYLKIKKGSIDKQKFTAYGESKINTLDVKNKTTKVTAYGEGSFQFNVSDDLKVSAFGEATVTYKGDPNLSKGIVIGEASIERIR